MRITIFEIFPDTRIIFTVSNLQVDEVRTADDALMRVKLMMFYELRDIEKMVWFIIWMDAIFLRHK